MKVKLFSRILIFFGAFMVIGDLANFFAGKEGAYEPCLTEQLWQELSAEIENYLTTISLADMMKNDEVQELSRAHDLRQNPSNLL